MDLYMLRSTSSFLEKKKISQGTKIFNFFSSEEFFPRNSSKKSGYYLIITSINGALLNKNNQSSLNY